jgi:hypothetical protein
MLVAMVVTGIVAWVAFGMFSGQKGNYTRTRDKIRMQDDAREAMRVIEEDVRNAGFRDSITMESSRLSGTATSCDANVLDGDRSAISPGNSDLLSGDTLRVRYIYPNVDGSVACTANFQEVGYFQSHDTLFRMTRQDTLAVPNWVPLLDNVVTFQVEYGLLVDTADTPVTAAAFANPAKWGGVTAAASGSGVAMNGWGTSNTVARLSGVPIALNKLYTYHVVFDLAMNDSMRIGTDALGTNGIDSNTTSGLPMFWIGFFSNSGVASAPGDTLYQYPGSHPGAPAYRRVEAYINPTSSGIRYFGICSKLRSGSNTAAKGQGITVSNGSIAVVSRGKYWSWLNAPSHAQKAHVKALKINLLVKTANTDKEGKTAHFTNLDAGTPPLSYTASGSDSLKSHILYQRIIPVVNNGI